MKCYLISIMVSILFNAIMLFFLILLCVMSLS